MNRFFAGLIILSLSIYLIDARGNGPGIPDEVRPISDPTSYIRKADGKFDITSPDGLIYSCDSCEFYIAKGCQVSGLRGGIRTDQTCDVEFQPREDGSDECVTKKGITYTCNAGFEKDPTHDNLLQGCQGCGGDIGV
ncbi:hypothetical protein MJO28_001968 [Puccinia striiformis f. sp. tritici]|uniref:Uncharacterized protein n=3 Tax=Puccinia striiformis TaxID=27350 RepID=A0A2S4UBT0_9BASI|nr:hypothetical protein Pst134EA_002792 [Puccinia striiformis f. sp. tritici]KAI9618133.1 hypothetical protein H4Q26_012477 [Puccinia striiformis f. sp. tritici PST-130]POV94737.1 hypothetical protein PSTT_16677 [Puccinia striiformis]KAH9464359.1 hypothetical protein Pst134EB_003888 [Puccinia striiformis f. sp. tritici]KAH9472167.1 hypothetical protein Pst134EA_002792 [Puccinia striiformis f. sp. tritici]KAI7961479.1 hypothetical protein MJO28_001968 [Puccinia striiformis f. sp. tritici]